MKRHIALIEDDEVIAGNYCDFRRMQGFAVDAYRTKEGAPSGLLANPPDLALVDSAHIQVHRAAADIVQATGSCPSQSGWTTPWPSSPLTPT